MNTMPQTDKSGSQRPNPVVVDALRRGSAAYETGDYPLALSILEGFSTLPQVQCFLGLIYLDDPQFAFERYLGWQYLESSATAGDEYAWLMLGRRYACLEPSDAAFEKAVYWLLKGAQKGCLYSQQTLAWCLCKLEIFVEASKWLFITVTLGNSDAQGLCDCVQCNMTDREYEYAQELALTWLMEKAKEPLDGFRRPLFDYCKKVEHLSLV